MISNYIPVYYKNIYVDILHITNINHINHSWGKTMARKMLFLLNMSIRFWHGSSWWTLQVPLGSCLEKRWSGWFSLAVVEELWETGRSESNPAQHCGGSAELSTVSRAGAGTRSSQNPEKRTNGIKWNVKNYMQNVWFTGYKVCKYHCILNPFKVRSSA